MFWLNTGQIYWTMSPTAAAAVLYVHSDGHLGGAGVDCTHGVRPVINLRADTQFQASGNGTSSNPYVVID